MSQKQPAPLAGAREPCSLKAALPEPGGLGIRSNIGRWHLRTSSLPRLLADETQNVNLCGLPWASQVAPVVKNPPANAGDTGSLPDPGRPRPVHRTTEPKPQSPCFTAREVTRTRSLCPAAREQPCSLKPEASPRGNEDPAPPKKKKKNCFSKCKSEVAKLHTLPRVSVLRCSGSAQLILPFRSIIYGSTP